MKTIKSLLTFGLSAVTALTITSCQDFDFMDEAEIKHDLTMNEYAQNFVAHYGSIDPNHTWGFGAIKGEGVTRVANVQRNQWASLDESQNIYHYNVPGWPDIDGKYQVQNGDSYLLKEINNVTSSDIPSGDVTDEEIKYVSWWFRTHRDPQSVSIHWTDFYVQEISSDNDRNSDGTRINEFKKKDGTTASNTQFGMDYLWSKYMTQQNGKDWDEVNNFNQGQSNNLYSYNSLYMTSTDSTGIWGDNISTTKRMIQFFQSSGTEDFSVAYSQDTKRRSTYDSNPNEKIWRLVHLTFKAPSGRTYDGYYLGFDYECDKERNHESGGDEIMVADHYFSNWIFKLSEATPREESGYARRVMCEDLGNTNDFDFNDVVFDVTYNISNVASYTPGTPIEATIVIQAAGGTMPIYVGFEENNIDENYEAHKLLGNNATKTPVNVGGVSSATANYHITVTSLDPADIPVIVYNSADNAYYKINYAATSNKHGLNNYTGSENNDHANVKNGTSNVPQSFCVPTCVAWMKECKFIETGYPLFSTWVKSQASCAENTAEAWFRNPTNTGNIYKYVELPAVNGGTGNMTPNNKIQPITITDLTWTGNDEKSATISKDVFANINSNIQSVKVEIEYEKVDENNSINLQLQLNNVWADQKSDSNGKLTCELVRNNLNDKWTDLLNNNITLKVKFATISSIKFVFNE